MKCIVLYSTYSEQQMIETLIFEQSKLKSCIVILQVYQNYIYTNVTWKDISTGPTSLNNSASASTILS